jgi:glutamyl-tRNA reductase
MAALAAHDLRRRGVGRLRILNRSVERARRLAARADGEAGGLDLLDVAIAHADLVVSSTGAAGLLIGAGDLRRARRGGGDRGRQLFVLDLAVPRDVDPAVAALPGVGLADIDDLKQLIDAEGSPASAEIDGVRAIVKEEVHRFASWRRAARLAPLIQALRDRGEATRVSELARLAPRLADLSPGQREAVEALAEGIVAKLLHLPIVRLKETTGPGGADALARALAELFDIPFRPGG